MRPFEYALRAWLEDPKRNARRDGQRGDRCLEDDPCNRNVECLLCPAKLVILLALRRANEGTYSDESHKPIRVSLADDCGLSTTT